MGSITKIDNVRATASLSGTKNAVYKTWSMAAAKSDVERDLISGVTIRVHDEDETIAYTVFIRSRLVKDGYGPLVDARTGTMRKFKTMDAAHSAIRQTGIRCDCFWGNAK